MSNLRCTLTTAFNQLDQLEEKISAISQRSSYLAMSPQSSNSYKGTVSTDHNISPSSSCGTLNSQEKTYVKHLEEDELCTDDSSTSDKITSQDSSSDIESSSDNDSVVEEKPLPSLKDAVQHEDQSDYEPSVSPGMFGFYGLNEMIGFKRPTTRYRKNSISCGALLSSTAQWTSGGGRSFDL